jgi:hypothetical protein
MQQLQQREMQHRVNTTFKCSARENHRGKACHCKREVKGRHECLQGEGLNM